MLTGGTLRVNSAREVGDGYIEWCMAKKKNPGHITDTKRVFREFLKTCGDRPLDGLTLEYFKKWRDHCQGVFQARRQKASWANRRTRIVKAAFRRCLQEGWLVTPVPGLLEMLSTLSAVSGPSTPQKTFQPDEFRMMLAATDLGMRTALLLSLNGAVGNADMGRVRWRDFEQQSSHGKETTLFAMPRGKTERPRRTPLWPATMSHLDRWRADRKQKGLAVGEDDFVWTTRTGTPWVHDEIDSQGRRHKADGFARNIRKLLKLLSITRKGLSGYSLRHTAATWATTYAGQGHLVAEGNQFLLGHAAAAMWKVYSHGVPPSLHHAVEAIWRGLNDGEDVVFDAPD